MDRSQPSAALPKLAIWHFLLWMACVAAIAAWNGAAIAPVQGSWLLKLQQVLQALTYYMISGLALAGLVLAIGCAVARKPYYPVVAGHWLLTIGGLIVLLSEGSNQVTNAWYAASGGTNQVAYAMYVGMYSFGLMTFAYLVGAWAMKDSWPWRLVFVGYAAWVLFWSITAAIWNYADRSVWYQWCGLGQRLQWPWQWLLPLAIVSLVASDLTHRRSRDWLHWTGVGYVAAWVISQSIVNVMHWLATH